MMFKKFLFLIMMLPLMAQTSPDETAQEAVRQRLLAAQTVTDLQMPPDLQGPQSIPINTIEIHADDAQAENYFGSSIAVDGDTMVIGAAGDSRPAGLESGSAYIFVWDALEGEWVQQAKLTAPDAAQGDYFGSAVAVSGDTVVIGAHGRDYPTEVNGGIAYIYVRVDTVWSLQSTLMPTFEITGHGGDFGYSVDIDGDTVVIGAPYYARYDTIQPTVYEGAGKA